MEADDALPRASWFAQMADGSGLIFFVLRIQPDVAYEYMSEAVFARLDVTATEAMADADTVHSRVAPEYLDVLAAALATKPGETASVELTWLHRNGRPLQTRCWMRARQRPDGSVILEGTVAEITELRDAEAELRHSEERHRLLAENAWDVVWTMAMDGTITYISPSIERVRGFTPEEAMKQTLEEISPPESATRVSEYYQQVFGAIAAGTEPPVFRGEIEYYRRDGSIMTGELQVIPHVDADGHVVELLGVTRDISERKMFETELTRLAAIDPMTGVWNRHHGRGLLAEQTTGADSRGRHFSVLMVDIDNFKSINDTHGHQAGDRVIGEAARRLREAVRATDVVARLGGEEFVVLLRDCPLADAVARAEKIRRHIAEVPFTDTGTVTVSVGAAELTAGEDLDHWLSRADRALYQAKRSGRNTVVAGERR